jgi:hypothetical protein
MQIKEVVEIAAVTLTALGGGAAIIFGFSSWLGKVWANRLMEKEKSNYAKELEDIKNKLTQDTESYKIKLKKSEFIFEKEYEAANDFIQLLNELTPSYSQPNMDWEDACVELAQSAGSIEAKVDSFTTKHGVVLNTEVSELLSQATNIVSGIKFEDPQDVPGGAIIKAGEMFMKLQLVERLLKEQVHSQAST